MENPDIAAEAALLFDCCPPAELKRNLNKLFFNFLISNHDVLPDDFKSLAENIYFLNEFFEKAEKHPILGKNNL